MLAGNKNIDECSSVSKGIYHFLIFSTYQFSFKIEGTIHSIYYITLTSWLDCQPSRCWQTKLIRPLDIENTFKNQIHGQKWLLWVLGSLSAEHSWWVGWSTVVSAQQAGGESPSLQSTGLHLREPAETAVHRPSVRNRDYSRSEPTDAGRATTGRLPRPAPSTSPVRDIV